MNQSLKSFKDVVRELSEEYNLLFEVVESALIDWTRMLYENMRCDTLHFTYTKELYPLEHTTKELSQKYGIPSEVMGYILTYWTGLLYSNIRGYYAED